MIKINKLPKPDILTNNEQQWTKELMSYVNKGETPPPSVTKKYNHPKVRESLITESRKKCMYCESIVSHIAYEHIEHYKPKAVNKFPELSFDWDNLGWSCPKCNQNKGDFFDTTVPFISPYTDTLSKHIVFVGGLIHHKNSCKRGELTISKLDLNRIDLAERRKARMDSVSTLVDKYNRETQASIKTLLKEQILLECDESREYSEMVRTFVKTICPGVL